MINIPSDLRKNKDKLIGNMDLRECICLFIGLLFALAVLYYIRVILGYKRIVIAAFVGGLFTIPFLFVGFKRINGMKIDDYLKVFINNRVLANANRLNINSINETTIKNKKYEMLRYYKVKDIKEMLKLRKYLIDKNSLILTEYVDYNGEKIVVFRLDAKDLILAKCERNNIAIKNKTKEIKDLINDIKKVRNAKYSNATYDSETNQIIKQRKLEQLQELEERLKKLKTEKKYLEKKTFSDVKEEVDIFENFENVKVERINILEVNCKKDIRNMKLSSISNIINDLRLSIQRDERVLRELNIFDKISFKDFIQSKKDKIVFINKDDKVDVFYYSNEEVSSIIDTIEIDKKLFLYRTTILSLEARNLYNHYRKINDLEEII